MARVGIVTPLYNGERFIAQTVESVLGQTMSDWQYVIVDDGSVDSSRAIAERFCKNDRRIRLIRQENGRVCRARNTGYASLSPEPRYLLFLDHDDVLEPDFLGALARRLDEDPAAGLVYTSLKVIDGNGELLPEGEWIHPQRYVPTLAGFRRQSRDVPRTDLVSLMAYFQCVPTSCLFRRTVYEAAGGWDEETGLLVYEDKDLVLRCALRASVHLVDEYLARYRWHETNASHADNPDYRRHYEQRWMHGAFLDPAQKAMARRGIAFDRRVSAILALRSARDEIRSGSLAAASRSLARGAYRLATSPLARIGF